MRKLIGFITAASIAAAAAVFPAAAEDRTVTGTMTGGTFHTDYSSGEQGIAVLNAYEEGTLVYSAHALKGEDGYTFQIPEEYRGAKLKICYSGGQIYDVIYPETAETEAPEETGAPEPTAGPAAAPTTEPTPAPEKTPYPEVYEKALDAVHAPAVVEEVSEQIIDGETYYVTTMLYQGTEIVSGIRETALISSAPQVHSDLIGKTAGYLYAGDVIHFICDLQGKIKSIDLIYRPDFIDYINSGQNYGSKFAALLGTDKYSAFYFGVPVKTAKGYMLLADAQGKTTDIGLNTGTFVYSVSRGRRGQAAELAGTGYAPIVKTYIQSGNFDTEDNVISWAEADELNYALARVVNGTATEVILFEN